MARWVLGPLAGLLVALVAAMVAVGLWYLGVAVNERPFDVGSFAAGAFSGAVGMVLGSQVAGAMFKL